LTQWRRSIESSLAPKLSANSVCQKSS
jgi:hypothetical protein